MNIDTIEQHIPQTVENKLREDIFGYQVRIGQLEQALATANDKIERQAKQIARLRNVNKAWQRCVEGKTGAAGESLPAVA